MRQYVNPNPSRSELDAYVVTALRGIGAARYSYVIRNHFAIERICIVKTSDVYASLRRLEKQGIATRIDTGRGNGSPYRYRWALADQSGGDRHGE